MKPTIGRIVLFILPSDYWQYVEDTDRVRPAVITRVVSDTSTEAVNRVNLSLIYDPTDVFRVDARQLVGVEEGEDYAGNWFWPPRS